MADSHAKEEQREHSGKNGESKQKNRISYVAIVRAVIKSSGLTHALIVFLIAFFACAGAIMAFDPEVGNYGDALWYCFQVTTTIGFEDNGITTLTGRIVTVVLSVISIFFIAIITGVVVNYTSEVLKARNNSSMTAIVGQLEDLPNMSKQELRELSERIKKIRKQLM